MARGTVGAEELLFDMWPSLVHRLVLFIVKTS